MRPLTTWGVCTARYTRAAAAGEFKLRQWPQRVHVRIVIGGAAPRYPGTSRLRGIPRRSQRASPSSGFVTGGIQKFARRGEQLP
jgi:hypothetical protein